MSLFSGPYCHAREPRSFWFLSCYNLYSQYPAGNQTRLPVHRVQNPIRLGGFFGGSIRARIASKTTRNRASHFLSRSSRRPYKVTVSCQCFAHADERPDDVNAYLDCSFRVKHGSRHDGAVFRECKGEYGREFQAGEAIAFCDNLRFLCRIQLEREIFRKSMPISFYLFIQACRGYSIQLRQIRIEYDPVPPA